jgi:MiaB/RimO family radical SAM methylthiotransferase
MGNCSYCAVKFAAGRVKSKKLDLIVREFEEGIRRGEKVFTLINTDVGSYGQDIGSNFAELLGRILDLDGQYRIRVIDFNPRWLIQYFDKMFPLLKKNKEKFACLSMPVQSASNRILGLMRRPYKIEDIQSCFRDLNKHIPELEINTHFIVGFPSETEQDFLRTLVFAKDFNFKRISIHPYNDRPNTESSKMGDKISDKIKFKRYRSLLSV